MPAPTLPKLLPIQSSHLAAAGHDPAQKLLAISFHDGSIYAFKGVLPGTYVALRGSKSAGQFFNQAIKGRYQSARLKGANPKP